MWFSIWDLVRRLLRPSLLFVFAALVGVPIVFWLPEWMVNQYGSGGTLTRDQYTKHVDDYRKTVSQLVAGVGGLYGLHLVWRRTRVAEASRITDLFTKAIEQLGKTENGLPNIEVRLGGIYALERLAFDSGRDHWTIMEALSAYVRRNAAGNPFDPTGLEDRSGSGLRTDIQAIMTVLGRRRRSRGREKDVYLDLSGCDLRFAKLEGAHFQEANLGFSVFQYSSLEHCDFKNASFHHSDCSETWLSGSNFENCSLWKTNLKKAKLSRARLVGARLEEADLQGALLMDADLRGANLRRAKLVDADLRFARLEGADLGGADLTGARLENATVEPHQLVTSEGWRSAFCDAALKAKLSILPSGPDAGIGHDL